LASALEGWRRKARPITGNRIEVVEVGEHEIARLLKSRRPLWVDIARDGVVIFGRPLSELKVRRQRSA
jgi:hypothetical protein